MSEAASSSVATFDSGDLRVQVTGSVVLVTIDRPDKKNALTQVMYQRMADALLEADSSADIGAVVITGVDDTFTAGNDLADFASGAGLDEVVRFLEAISSVRVPVVAAVNGLAIGVGLTMLLHCDLVYVEPAARLSAPFVALGLVPEAASSLLLPRVIGERRASEVLLAGRASAARKLPIGDWPTPPPARPSPRRWRRRIASPGNPVRPSGRRSPSSARAIAPSPVGWPRRWPRSARP